MRCSIPLALTLGALPLVCFAPPARPLPVHRTPDVRFVPLDDFPFAPNYVELDGLRLHYVDEGEGTAGTVLLLHGEPTWSYIYRRQIPEFVAAGYRTIVPDMIGFGRSDKVTDPDWYTVDNHVAILKEFINDLELQDITLVVHDWGGPVGLITATDLPERFERLVILNTWLHHDGFDYTERLRQWRDDALTLDFTDLPRFGFRAPFDRPAATVGAQRWPWMLPYAQPEAGAAQRQAAAYAALADWDKPAHLVFGDQDQIFTVAWGQEFAVHIPGATFTTVEAGHFVQSFGAPLAEVILQQIALEAHPEHPAPSEAPAATWLPLLR